MKKVLLALAVTLAFALTAVGQQSGAEGQSSTTTTTTTTKTKTKKSKAAAGTEGSQAAATKEAHLTGCLSKEANAEGSYTLTNGRYKKGVEVGPADQVKEHAGHQVKLTGTWTTGEAMGEKEPAAEKGKERHFNVTKVDHMSDTCTAAGAMGKGKGKKTGAAEAPKS